MRRLALTYNSRVWHKVTGTPTKVYFDVDAGWPAPGFRLGYGQIESQGTAGFTLTEPDGTRREMLSIGASKYRTTDGSIITYEGSQYGGLATYPTALKSVMQPRAMARAVIRIALIDRHGNYVAITYVGGVGTEDRVHPGHARSLYAVSLCGRRSDRHHCARIQRRR